MSAPASLVCEPETVPSWRPVASRLPRGLRPDSLSAMVRAACLALAALPLLSGCIARTVADVATASVGVVGKAVDLTTTSQSEADAKRGRALREREERIGRLERRHDEQARDCARGDDEACEDRDESRAELDRLMRPRP